MIYYLLIASYLIGSIPFGLVLCKIFAKKDPREHGSGNIGATNVIRTVGKKLGIITFLLDGGKGAFCVLLARIFFPEQEYVACLAVFFAVLGHIIPVWLKLRGGKGVATTLISLLALDPKLGLLMIISWLALFFLFKRVVSIASVLSILIITIYATYHEPMRIVLLCFGLSILIIIKHRANFKRIKAGEEKGVGKILNKKETTNNEEINE